MRALSSAAMTAALVMTLAAPMAAQQSDRVPLDRVMSPSEMTATGVARLNSMERAMLEAWLARYTAVAAAAASSAPRSHSTRLETAVTEANGAIERSRARQEDADPPGPRTVPVGALLSRLEQDGGFVLLADGSMWEIYLPDRTSTVTWSRGDYILVKHHPVPHGDHSFLLTNGAARKSVAARFAGWVRGSAPRQGT